MLLVSFYNLRKTFELNVIPATSRCEKSLVSILIGTGSENHVKNHLDGAYMESGYGSLRYSWKLRNAEIRCLAGSYKRVSLVFAFDSSASACVSNSSQGGSSLTRLLAFLLSRVIWKHTIIITTISKPSGRKPATAKAVERNWTTKPVNNYRDWCNNDQVSLTSVWIREQVQVLISLRWKWLENGWSKGEENPWSCTCGSKILKDMLPRRHLRFAADVSPLLKNYNQFRINFLFKDVFPKANYSDYTTTSFKVRVIYYASASRTIIGREPWPHPREIQNQL